MSRPRCVYCGFRTAAVVTWRRWGVRTCRACDDLPALDLSTAAGVESAAVETGA